MSIKTVQSVAGIYKMPFVVIIIVVRQMPSACIDSASSYERFFMCVKYILAHRKLYTRSSFIQSAMKALTQNVSNIEWNLIFRVRHSGASEWVFGWEQN